jgi:hypothetical protein
MINRYRRAAHPAFELGLGVLTPLDAAIPELGDEPPGDPEAAEGGKADGKSRQVSLVMWTGSGTSPKSLIVSSSTEGGTRTHKPLRIADFETEPGEPNRGDGADFPKITGAGGALLAPVALAVAVSPSPFADSPAPSSPAPSPRAALLDHLYTIAREAVAAGDLEAARVAHEAAGKLLAASPASPAGATVVDLARERGKRGRR